MTQQIEKQRYVQEAVVPIELAGIPEAHERRIDDDMDLKQQAVKVHTEDMKEITSDLVMADLSDEILKSKVLRFIQEQMKLAIEIKEYLRDQREGDIEVKKIMAELTTMMVGSRAVGGKVLNSVLRHGEMIGEMPMQAPMQTMEEKKPKKKSILSRLGRGKKKEAT